MFEFNVKVFNGEVYINDEFVSQISWDSESIGCAVTEWLEERGL